MAEEAGVSLFPVQSRVRASVGSEAGKPAAAAGWRVGKAHKLCKGFGSITQDFCLLYPRGCQGVPGCVYPIRSEVLNLPEPVSCLYHGDSVPSWWGCFTRAAPDRDL